MQILPNYFVGPKVALCKGYAKLKGPFTIISMASLTKHTWQQFYTIPKSKASVAVISQCRVGQAIGPMDIMWMAYAKL